MYTKERVSRIRYCIERDENAVGVVGEETVAAALAAVDSARMHDTIVDFPIASCDLCLVTGGDEAGPPRLADLLASGAPPRSVVGDLDGPLEEQTPGYDPQFILPWLWAVVSCGESVDLRRVIECHAAGVAIAALSSASPPVRKIAYFILDLLYTEVAEAEYLIGKRQCMLLLDALRNGITGRTATEFPRLPFPLTLFAATALHTMVHPEHAMFGNVNRLLLKRPYLRAGGIPLLRVVLRSSMDTHAHRALVLAQACQAARAFSQCPAAFRRCDLVNLVLAVATSTLADAQAGRAALTMLFHLTSPANTAVLAEHVSKGQFSLLAWIRAQISLEANSLRAAAAQARAQLNRPGGPGIAPPTAQALLAATANLTALARLVVRTAANFPPVKLGTGALAYNRFWAVTSPDQPGAAGQSAAMCVFQQALDAAADAMSLLDTAVGARQALAAVALVRTCVDGAQLLADIQRTCAFSKAPALQSPRLVRSALALVRLTEPAVEREAATAELECPVSFVVRHDPCAVAAVAHAQHPAALFATETALAGVGDTSLTPATRGALGLYACYRACIDGLFVWATATPGRSAESMDIVSRALVVGAPASASAVAWMRSCRDLTDQETIF
ncbi:hypothetical protein H4R19_002526 [Coemansia spiralis]|nr:hypothetical protein H4R19_002526 [Coemansia spiralis]